MPNATVTVRQVKNKATGIDLSIPAIKEISGILTDTIEYHVLVVSNLQYFKLPQHRENDVVQFIIVKMFEDFELLHKGLSNLFPGTDLPPLTKSSMLSFLDTYISKKSELEMFLRFVAATPKLAKCHLTLEFLGVNPVTAGKFTSSELSSNEGRSSDDPAPVAPPQSSLFQDEDDDQRDLFGSKANEEEDIFLSSSNPSRHKTNSSNVTTRLYQEPNLDLEGVDLVKESQLLVEGACIQSKISSDLDKDEDLSDLLRIDDDINRLLKLQDSFKAQSLVSQKSAPTAASKLVRGPSSTDDPLVSSATKPVPSSKPLIGKKPTLPPKPGTKMASKSMKPAVDSMATDDILKYIQDNSDLSEQDLFL